MLSDIAAADYLGWNTPRVAGYWGDPRGHDINSPGSWGLQKQPAPKEHRFSVSYHLLRVASGAGEAPRIRLQVWCEDGEPLPSVVEVWPTADWHEREAWDLMGIRFEGHPNHSRILLEDDWEGHPLRKDYPLGGEPVRFRTRTRKQSWPSPSRGQRSTRGRGSLADPDDPPGRPALREEDDILQVNFGPNHPSTHGVLRLVVDLNGEKVVGVRAVVGYLHTGFEKNMEHKTWWKAITYPERIDYVSFQNNELVFVLAIEKLLERRAAAEGAVDAHAPLRAQPDPLPPRLARHRRARAGGDLDVLVLLPRAGRHPRPLRAGHRRPHAHALLPGGRARRGHPGRLLRRVPHVRRHDAEARRRVRVDPLGQAIWLERTKGIGLLSAEDAIALGQTGPVLRASGVDWDLRKAQPYLAYDQVDFDVPVYPAGTSSTATRCTWTRCASRRASSSSASTACPRGRGSSDDRKIVLPPRHELHTSMESLIHHFKLVTEGYRVPEGEVYVTVESPRGELGCYLVSDGGPKPWRVKFRAPSFVALEATATCMSDALSPT